MTKLWLVLVPLLSGCWVNIKTPLVARYERLDDIPLLQATQDEIELAIGTPQAVGTRQTPEGEQPTVFYQGAIGRASITGSMNVDAGMVIVSYSDRLVEQALYARSEINGPTIKPGASIPVGKLADRLTLGSTPIAEAQDLLGEAPFRGKRADRSAGIQNDILWYESSRQQAGGGPFLERFLLLGYDKQGITQDLFWVSSYPEDLKALGEVQPQNFNQLSKLDIGPWTAWSASGVSSALSLDPIQVDALLRTHPDNVEQIVALLGKPTGRGIKAFQGHEPLLVSSWVAVRTEIVGRESIASQSTIPTPQSREGAPPRSTSYVVMTSEQSRLFVAHTPDGRIMEIIWFAPRVAP